MKQMRQDNGITLIETMIATVIALVGVFGLGSLVFQATVTNKNQGTEMTRSVIYAQDKMEKLLSLDFTNCTLTAGSQPASCNTTNITDSGWTQGLLAGGPIDATAITTTPVASTCPAVPSSSQGYLDFLDANGIQLPSGGGACSAVIGTNIAYVREWTITDLTAFTGGPPIKKVTVAVYSLLGLSVPSKPIVVITSIRSNPN
jgi:type II secretory pathway pseudopilin PulG